MKYLEGIYDLNVYVDEERLENGEGQHWKAVAYKIGVDPVTEGRVTITHIESEFEFEVKVPEGVDMFTAQGGYFAGGDTWLDTDAENLEPWLADQITRALKDKKETA